jgi:hypothetical protein
VRYHVIRGITVVMHESYFELFRAAFRPEISKAESVISTIVYQATISIVKEQ